MSSEWYSTTVGYLVDSGEALVQTGPFGSQLHQHDYVEEGTPVIPTEAIGKGRILDIAVPKVSLAKASELERHRLRAGDILFARRGAQATGLSAIIDARFEDALCGTGALLLRTNSKRVLPRFLSLYLSSDFAYMWLRTHAVGAVMPNLNTDIIKALPLNLPPVQVQLAVSDFLGAIEDRITLLRETNTTLQTIAQALFKSWFVDFDPVRAKQEGRSPEGMDEATAALFPDSFEDSELGLVPKGWKVGALGDLAQLHKGTINPLNYPEDVFEHYSLPAFDTGQMPVFEAGSEIKSNKTNVPANAVLLSKLNPHIPRIWLPVDSGQNAVSSTEFLVFVPKHGATREFVFCMFSTPQFQQSLCQLVTGTSNSHQRVKPDGVVTMSSVLPIQEVVVCFGSVVKPIFDRIGHNRRQAQTLSTLRDTLLPRLISGQLRLPEAEALAA